MRIRHTSVKFKKGQSTQDVIFSSCWHIGNPACRERHIEELMRVCREDRIPWVMLGDIIEAIVPIDPRFHCETHQETILAQVESAAGYMAQGLESCIGLHVGNHEDKVSAKFGDVTSLCLRTALRMANGKMSKSSLDTKSSNLHLGGTAFTHLRCPDGTCTVFTGHSRLSVSSAGTSDPDRDRINRAIRLRRKLSPWQADIKVVGHGHINLIAPPVQFAQLKSLGDKTTQQSNKLRPEWCAMSASMFVNYDNNEDYPDYAELAMYPPTDIGYIRATINRKGQVLNVQAVDL